MLRYGEAADTRDLSRLTSDWIKLFQERQPRLRQRSVQGLPPRVGYPDSNGQQASTSPLGHAAYAAFRKLYLGYSRDCV